MITIEFLWLFIIMGGLGFAFIINRDLDEKYFEAVEDKDVKAKDAAIKDMSESGELYVEHLDNYFNQY